jgi:hypothetical protein
MKPYRTLAKVVLQTKATIIYGLYVYQFTWSELEDCLVVVPTIDQSKL